MTVKYTGVNTGQAKYVQCNVVARLSNHCCTVKAINITYSERAFVALGI